MDDRLEDLFENVLSIAIYDLIPSLSGNRVKNKLLDGTLHIQTIGEPLKYVSFRCVSNDSEMNQINAMEYAGQGVKVFYDDRYYIGLIDDLSKWREEIFGERDNRLYTANIVVVVSQEGTI